MEWQAQKIGIEKGDKMTLDQALHYLMVYSANDAAVLIAEHVGRDYDDFIDMMNEEAEKLGATKTHFVNPHGLHDEDHYTTAYDLFLIFSECLKYDKFRELIDLNYYSTVFHDKDGNIRAIEVPSTDNYLLGYVNPPSKIKVIGGKTGTTDQAGSCLILLSKNAEGREFVSVVLGAIDGNEVYTAMNRLLRQERGYPPQE
jgi:D-alanyl-D-alanine carboxypeptidase